MKNTVKLREIQRETKYLNIPAFVMSRSKLFPFHVEQCSMSQMFHVRLLLMAEAEASFMIKNVISCSRPLQWSRISRWNCADGSVSMPRSYKRIKGILESSDDDDSPPLQ